jgi:hypothetical protein
MHVHDACAAGSMHRDERFRLMPPVLGVHSAEFWPLDLTFLPGCRERDAGVGGCEELGH